MDGKKGHVACFLLEETGKVEQKLRRFSVGDTPACSHGYSYHNAMFTLPDRLFVPVGETIPSAVWPADDPRWPVKCEACDYEFTPEDHYDLWRERIYRHGGTGALTTRQTAPPGAMWFVHWYEQFPEWCGPDGKALLVKLPDGAEWHVDGRANNCTMPDDKVHKCWVRQGTPPLVTVGKDGVTCKAGAGSIKTSRWHGFLRNGVLVPC